MYDLVDELDERSNQELVKLTKNDSNILLNRIVRENNKSPFKIGSNLHLDGTNDLDTI